MCREISQKFTDLATIPEPLTRNFRRVMKPRLPRKVTASARINLNRFWNELEEFYNRYDDRKEKPVVKILPEYTTDTFDHVREAAENDLNEQLDLEDSNAKTSTKVLMTRARLASDDIEIGYSSADEYSNDGSIENACINNTDEVFLWNQHENSMPRPPKTLMDLIHRLSM